MTTSTTPFPIWSTYSDADRSLLLAAECIAIEAHRGQTRRGGAPYIEHPRAVAARLTAPFEKAVGLLHDVLEADCANRLTVAELTAALSDHEEGREVVDGVVTLTRTDEETYDEFISRIIRHREGAWRRAKAADCLANLADGPSAKQIHRYCAALRRLVPSPHVFTSNEWFAAR